MELLLLHLALDKIGQTWEWSADLCECGHSIPALAQPAWQLYEALLGASILALAFHVIDKEE